VIDEVRNAYLKAGVSAVVDSGYSYETSLSAKENAEKYSEVFFTAGYHPDVAGEVDFNAITKLKPLLKHEKCLAVGETGLDYHYLNFSKQQQNKAFRLQLDLAVETKLPVIVHSRDACKDTLDVLSEYAPRLKGFLMHCYSESKETAKILTDLGAYFSFGGVTTFKNAKKDEIIKSIPKERILLETDCPYMAPEPFRGKMNTPEYMPYIYEKVASVYGETASDFAQTVKANFERFFKK
jgi:TatD DNase family protein